MAESVIRNNNLLIQRGTVSSAGVGNWKVFDITFSKPYKDIPVVVIHNAYMQNPENYMLTNVTKTGFSFGAYCPTTSWTYIYSWQAIGT